MSTLINKILLFSFFPIKNNRKKKKHFVKFFVGKKLNKIPLLQNYPSFDELKTEQYFVGETKDGFAHGRGKLFNHHLCDNLYIIDGQWENGIIPFWKTLSKFGSSRKVVL